MEFTHPLNTDAIIIKMGANHSVREIFRSLFKMGFPTNEEYVVKCLRNACIIPTYNYI